MAKEIILQVVGAPIKRGAEASDLGELVSKYDIPSSYSAFVNNKPVSAHEKANYALSDGDMVIFTGSVKGNQAWEDKVDNPAIAEELPVFPKVLFASPVLNIISTDYGVYKVNGLEIGFEDLGQLYDALEEEVMSFENEVMSFKDVD